MTVDELIASGCRDGRLVTLTGIAFTLGYVAQVPFEEFTSEATKVTLGGGEYRPGMSVPVIAHQCFVAAPGTQRRKSSRSEGLLLRYPGLGAVLSPWGTIGDEVSEVGPITVAGRIVPSAIEPYWGMLIDITVVEATIGEEWRLIDLAAVAEPDPEVVEATMRSDWSTAEEKASFVRYMTVQHTMW